MSRNRRELVRAGFGVAVYAALCVFGGAGMPAVVQAASVRLFWDANTETDLAGYVLVWGTATGVYTQSMTIAADQTSVEVPALAPGAYFFALRAFNTAGLHSAYSNEVMVTVAAETKIVPLPLVGVSAIILRG